MKTYNNATTTDLRNKVAEWSEMTQNNEHSEVLCDIAYFFEMGDDYVCYFWDFCCKDGLTMEEFNERKEMSDKMLQTIKAQYGDTAYALIQKAL